MKTPKLTCLSLLVVAGALAGANGQPSATNINPALLYYQAFLAAPDLEPADREYLLMTNDWRGQKLSKRFGDLIAKYDGQFGLVRLATRATVPCDWGIDLSAGPATLLPHLARAKAVAIAARVRTLWDLQQGRPADACDDLVASLVLGRNLSRDGTLISGLVQMAIEAIVCSPVAENFGRFSPETLQRLVEGFDAAPARGTVAFVIPAEKSFSHDWTLRKIQELQQQNPGNDAEVMAGIRQFLGFADPELGETNRWERFTQAAGGTSDGVIRLLQERVQVYDRVAALLALPYPEYESQVRAFREEIEKSPNPFINESFSGLLKSRAKEFRIQVTLAMVRAAVEYKLHGIPGLQSVTEPCGQGPFGFRRFVFEGVDRGFELKSALYPGSYQQVLIFVEKDGPPFLVDGPRAGQAKR
jgi:hypothetical protein